MLPYVSMEEFENIGDKLYEYAPKLGSDFTRIGQIAMNDTIRDRLKDMADFSFSFRGDEKFTEERVKKLEWIVRKQAMAILSNEKLQTKDVFFSPKAIDDENRIKKAENAACYLDKFLEYIDKNHLVINAFDSICKDENAVQYYLEEDSYLLTVDFLNGKVEITSNARNISIIKLKEESPEFYRDVNLIEKSLCAFVKEQNCSVFMHYFNTKTNGVFGLDQSENNLEQGSDGQNMGI